MTLALRQLAALVAKDLRIEARTRQTLGLVIVLGVLILVVLGLGLGQQVTTGAAATSVLWVAYLFGGVLCFEKTMALERQDGALAGLMLAPVDRSILYAAKLISNLALMAVLVVVITVAGVVLFNFNLTGGSWAPFRGFLLVTVLGLVGFAAVGTLFAAATSSTKLQGGLLALVIFPICLPLVITSTQLMTQVFSGVSGGDEGSAGLSAAAIGTLLSFDVVYLILSWLVFELLLEP